MSQFSQILTRALMDDRRRRDRPGAQGSTISFFESLNIGDIAAALAGAQRGEGQPVPEHFLLPDYPGQVAELKIGGRVVGSHGLDEVDGRLGYAAQMVVEGSRCPAIVLVPRSLVRGGGSVPQDFGREVRMGVDVFDDSFRLHSTSSRAARELFDASLIPALGRVQSDLVRVEVATVPHGVRVEVRVRVEDARRADKAVEFARAAYASVERLAHAAGGFADEGVAEAASAEDLQRLVQRVQESTAFLAGHVERVGDGVEARFELDRPEDQRGMLRVEPTGAETVRVWLRGSLASPPEGRAVLSPEVGLVKKARGMFDPRLGHDALDKAFLVDGDRDLARLAVAEPDAALRLAARGATLTVDAEGITVVVPSVLRDDAAILEATVGAVACWRTAALRNAGFVEENAP